VRLRQNALRAQEWNAVACNDVSTVFWVSIRTGPNFDAAARKAVEAGVNSRGGTIEWREQARLGRTYGLAGLPRPADLEWLAAALPGEALVRDAEIVALEIAPSEPQAVAALAHALGGEGRPVGVVDCAMAAGAVAIEWNVATTAPALLLASVDVELARWNCSRRTELLCPLPHHVATRIAAQGLQSPEIAEDRVLETLVERAGLA